MQAYSPSRIGYGELNLANYEVGDVHVMEGIDQGTLNRCELHVMESSEDVVVTKGDSAADCQGIIAAHQTVREYISVY